MMAAVMGSQRRPARISWSESISVASTAATDRASSAGGYSYRRSTSVGGGGLCQPGRPNVRRREGVHLGLSLTPTEFAESVLCYVGCAGTSPGISSVSSSSGGSSVRRPRRHKSTVKYDGVGLTARRYFETWFILPTSSVKHRSQLDAQPLTDTARRWYTAALKLLPRDDSVPGSSPTSPDWSTPSWDAADDNNNRAASGGGGDLSRSGGSERITGDDSVTYSSRVVVHVQPDEP